ncbi:hypothetical protein DPMN_100796 [Dreissena polymorpha]|uniref:Uncharacterized protein n=1 Tax=Dreissena polymorpha TaxID=45954 RepID=A0A9D4LJW7_DREPO|nr:hypothetical protein DPMN_100796 [Dreissena polymorpha]
MESTVIEPIINAYSATFICCFTLTFTKKFSPFLFQQFLKVIKVILFIWVRDTGFYGNEGCFYGNGGC